MNGVERKDPSTEANLGIRHEPRAYTAKGGGQREAGVDNEVWFVVTAVDFEGQKRKCGGNGVLLMSTVVLVGDGGGGGAAAAKNALQTNVADHKIACTRAMHVSAGKRFAHTGAFDGNGVLHWIGTGCGTTAYANTHGKPAGVVAKDGTWRRTTNYCLRHGANVGNFRLRNWLLEGSNDASTWTLLKTHANDQALPAQGWSTASWPIEATADGASYRYFRIFQTGENSDGYDYLMCAGIELYGLLR
eukprot:gene16851-biopygen30184